MITNSRTRMAVGQIIFWTPVIAVAGIGAILYGERAIYYVVGVFLALLLLVIGVGTLVEIRNRRSIEPILSGAEPVRESDKWFTVLLACDKLRDGDSSCKKEMRGLIEKYLMEARLAEEGAERCE